MVALVLLAMSSLVWMIMLTAELFAYKLAPAPRWTLALSVALVALGVV
jgi:hypothetical protein